MPPPGSRLIGLLRPDASDEDIQAFIDRSKEMAAEEEAQARQGKKPQLDR